jgi:hypothetical protein
MGTRLESDAFGRANPLPVMGRLARRWTAFSRPADTTTYAAGDLIANATSAGAVVVGDVDIGGAAVLIVAAKVAFPAISVGGVVRVHLFDALPTLSGGDNAPLAISGTAGWLGSIDVGISRAFADGAVGRGVPDGPVVIDLSTGATIWIVLEALSGISTAAGATITTELEIVA